MTGIEPAASRSQSERSTDELHPEKLTCAPSEFYFEPNLLGEKELAHFEHFLDWITRLMEVYQNFGLETTEK